MIIDCHAHIRSADDEELGRLLRRADRAGVDKLCISSLGREWTYFPEAARLEEALEDVSAAVAKHPDRLLGQVYLSADHADLSLALLERAVEGGACRSVKLWVSQFAGDPRLDPIYERVVELGVPVMQHTWIKATGNLEKESTCHHVLEAARRHPDLKIWMAHASGRWEESGRIVAEQPNIAVDISGGEPENGIVECLVDALGAERVFYGSDAPGRSFEVQMSKVLAADIPENQKEMILGENVRRWLHV